MSLRQINRNKERWTSAALLVAWVFLILTLFGTTQSFANSTGADNENDKAQGSVSIIKVEGGKG